MHRPNMGSFRNTLDNDYAELEPEIKRSKFKGCLVVHTCQSCEDANLVVSKKNPCAFNQYFLSFVLNH
jgi:hypothetical protein